MPHPYLWNPSFRRQLVAPLPPTSDTAWHRRREQRRAERHEVVRKYRRAALLRRRAKLQRLRSSDDDDDDNHSPPPDRIFVVSKIVDVASRNRRGYHASTSPTVILDNASIVDTDALMWTVDAVTDYDHDSTTDDASEGGDDDDDDDYERRVTNMAVVELEKQSAAATAALATPAIAADTIIPPGVDYVLVSHGYVVHGAYRPRQIALSRVRRRGYGSTKAWSVAIDPVALATLSTEDRQMIRQCYASIHDLPIHCFDDDRARTEHSFVVDALRSKLTPKSIVAYNGSVTDAALLRELGVRAFDMSTIVGCPTTQSIVDNATDDVKLRRRLLPCQECVDASPVIFADDVDASEFPLRRCPKVQSTSLALWLQVYMNDQPLRNNT